MIWHLKILNHIGKYKSDIIMQKIYSISEYGSFIHDKNISGYTSLPESTFDALEDFLLSNCNQETDALELMVLSSKKGIGKIIKAKNYIGIIAMKDGTVIEILPKIYSSKKYDTKSVKLLLIEMLKTLKNTPFKSLQMNNLDIEKIPVLEIFIRMYIDEVFQIVKKGLKCNYETKSSNESLFRGKMNFSNQIKYNYAHKERCFVEYDDFNTNRIENILLKSTLELLYKKTISSKNKMDIKTLLNSFQDVNTSDNYKKDFDKIVIDRNTKDYQKALVWSKIFLMNKSFSSFSGSHVAFSLLFPMETLFESYIAFNISKLLKTTDYNVTIQDRRFYLFDKPTKKFALRPDIVIHNDESCHPIIIDTKWKLLAENKINCGISQIDMYQMYAYHKKFNARKVILVYPKAEQFISNKKINYYSQDGVDIRINFVDLFNLNNSLINIIDLLD